MKDWKAWLLTAAAVWLMMVAFPGMGLLRMLALFTAITLLDLVWERGR